MKFLRVMALAAALAVVGAGCAPAGGHTLDADARAEALANSAHAPRTFTLTSTRSGEEIEMSGNVEDDYRYTATVSIEGRDVYEEIVIDDRRWLRVLGTAGLTPAASSTLAATPELAPVVAGEWVIDAGGAPPEFEAGSARPRLLGPGPVLDVIRRLDTLESDGESVTRLRAAREYDPESVNYLEREDKFDRHPEDGVRFDIKPIAYDPDAIFGSGVPTNLEEVLEPFALYTSFWIDEGRVTRIETFFDIDRDTVAEDLAAIIRATAQDSGVAAAAPPAVPHPYRETFTLGYPEPPPRIAAPETTIRLRLPELPERPSVQGNGTPASAEPG